MSHSTYPSLRQLADQLSEMPEYAPLRTYIRGTISMALGETKRESQRELTDRECISHSLIASWLEQNGYHIPAQMMRTQMAENYQKTPENFLLTSEQNIDYLLKSILKVRVPKLDRKPKKMENEPRFPKVDPVEMKRQPIKIIPLTDDQFRRSMRIRLEQEKARLARVTNKMAEDVDSSDSSDSDSSDPSSSSSTTPVESPEKTPEPEEKLTFSDILKSSKSEDEESSDEPKSGGGLEFLSNPIPKAWGPSKSALVTDDVATSSSALPSLAHLPPLSLGRPTLKSTKSQEIDALFDEDGGSYGLDDFDDEEQEEVTPRKEDVAPPKKPVNVVPPVLKKEEEPKKMEQMEPLALSEGESIDELEEFDTGLLSSGGSDYSF